MGICLSNDTNEQTTFISNTNTNKEINNFHKSNLSTISSYSRTFTNSSCVGHNPSSFKASRPIFAKLQRKKIVKINSNHLYY